MNFLKANNRSGYIAYDSEKEIAIILEVHSDETEIIRLTGSSFRKDFKNYDLNNYAESSNLEFLQSLTFAIADVTKMYLKYTEMI